MPEATSPRPVGEAGTSYRAASGWQDEAACSSAGLSTLDAQRRLDLFALRTTSELKPHGFDPKKHPKVAEALKFCEGCPVIEQCRQYPKEEVDYPLVGVWGGTYIGWRDALANLAEAHRDGRKVRNTRSKYE